MMLYNADTLIKVVNCINPSLIDMYERSDIFLPTLIDLTILDLWTNEKSIPEEYENILRKAKKDIDNKGYCDFAN